MAKFGKVEIFEKSSKEFGNYFEIKILESKEVDIIIPVKNLDTNAPFIWSYKSNPLSESSDLIPRISSVGDIADCVIDIIENNRFSRDYLKS